MKPWEAAWAVDKDADATAAVYIGLRNAALTADAARMVIGAVSPAGAWDVTATLALSVTGGLAAPQLAPTVTELKRSAINLLERMIDPAGVAA